MIYKKLLKRVKRPSMVRADLDIVYRRFKGFLYKFRYLLNRNIKIGSNFRIMGSLRILAKGKVYIGDNVEIGRFVEIVAEKPEAIIRIGNDVKLIGSSLYAWKEIIVGNLCLLANCGLSDTNSHSIHADRRTNPNAKVKVESIYIKDNVWIGKSALILKGVSVGENSVIGAGSVVIKSVPANSVFAGNPAKFIKKI